MKNLSILFVLAASVVASINSCSKYPENPPFSFYPRGERVEGKWKANKVLFNSIDSTSSYTRYIWEFTRNQSVILQTANSKQTGFWTTGNSYKDFIIELDNGNRSTYEIRKLLRKEFWIKDRKTQVEYQLVLIK